jgi:cytochrome P450
VQYRVSTCQYLLNHPGLRLLSPVGSSRRQCTSECVLPAGGGPSGKSPILVTPGMQVIVDFQVMQCDPDIWGPDAAEFRPERWEKSRPLWNYIPFLGGPRMCPAQQMVLTQYALVLVKMMRKFGKMESKDPEIRFVEEHKITKQSRNGVMVSFVPA